MRPPAEDVHNSISVARDVEYSAVSDDDESLRIRELERVGHPPDDVRRDLGRVVVEGEGEGVARLVAGGDVATRQPTERSLLPEVLDSGLARGDRLHARIVGAVHPARLGLAE